MTLVKSADKDSIRLVVVAGHANWITVRWWQNCHLQQLLELVTCKGTFRLKTDHTDSALDEGKWSTPRPGCFTHRKEYWYPLLRGLGGSQGLSGLNGTNQMHNINPLMPNDDYSGRTAPLTSKCCILYIYSTNIGTEYFKHVIYSQFFPLQNVVCFIILTYLVPLLFTFYIQCALKLKK